MTSKTDPSSPIYWTKDRMMLSNAGRQEIIEAMAASIDGSSLSAASEAVNQYIQYEYRLRRDGISLSEYVALAVEKHGQKLSVELRDVLDKRQCEIGEVRNQDDSLLIPFD